MVNCIVIDDDQNIVDMFCELLKIVDVNVLATGNNGKDAVSLYEKQAPDIVFTDLQMPTYDGLYAVENIKDKNTDAKIIIVTGDLNAENSIILDSLNIPIIHKPFDINTVKQAITDVLLAGDTLPTPFEIQYKFKKDANSYSCTLTYKQYKNFKKLPIIQECEIVNNVQKITELQQNEMQKAIDLACKNDLNHIRNWSKIVR